MSFRKKLLERITALGNGSHTIHELENKLNFRSKTERKVLRSAIRDMIEDGELVNNGRGQISVSRKKELIKGELRGNRKGFAFMIREDEGEDMFIPARSLNGAMHGDTVLAYLVGESEGKVETILKQGITSLVGTYTMSGGYGFVIPDDDSYYKDILIPSSNVNNATPLDKVVVKISINERNKKPFGEILEVLGKAGDRDTEVLSVLRQYGFDENFPKDIELAAAKVDYKPDYDRLDLRDILTITIDGDDAKDFDDAISIEKKSNGYKLYVHIADVSHYVRIGSELDEEALKRTTSVYFPDKVFPMLPPGISNGVCSLRPNEDKLTVTVIMDLDEKGEITSSTFHKTTTCSNYRMTYNKVTKILQGDKELNKEYSEIVEMLEYMKELASFIKIKRDENGAINFDTKECKFKLDAEGDVLDIVRYPYELSNSIIEQFMVLANEQVAKYLTDQKVPAVFRVHEVPSQEKLSTLKVFLAKLGYDIDLHKDIEPKIFSDILEKVKDSKYDGLINKVVLRSMQKANYKIHNQGHFGLSLDYYCHFTSPIRRYPDLMVHRMLKALIDKKATKAFIDKLRPICLNAAKNSSDREVSAERAERDIDDYYKTRYELKHIGDRYFGVVSGVIGAGIFVALENTVEGFVPATDLPSDKYTADESTYTYRGFKYQFALGDEVEVEVKSALVETRRINMVLVSEPSQHLNKKG